MDKVRFLNLTVEKNERDNFIEKLISIMEDGQIVLGPEVTEFEKNISKACSRKFATGVGSGSDAVYIALSSLNLNKGDEIITTSLSWIATANAVALTGATPVFADINDDLNISPNSVQKLITPKTKAILSVDYTGRLADVRSLVDICNSNNLHLVEDGSQAFGAKRDGYTCGGYGIVSAISHNPMKVLSALGEAGSVLTDDPEIKDRLDSLRYNGTINKEYLVKPSINGRIDTIQAAILNVRLSTFESLIKKRASNAEIYNELLDRRYIQVPKLNANETHVYYTYTILAEKRDQLFTYLQQQNIECKIQHPILMPEQPPFKECTSEITNALKLKAKLISLPIHEKLTRDDIEKVCYAVNKFYSNK